MPAEVVRVTVARDELTAARVPALRELFGLERLPLAESRVEVEVRGVPTAAVNALRRVVTDEMPGRCLQVPAGGFDTALTDDAYLLPEFCVPRLAHVPLRPQIPADVVARLRLELDVTNPGATGLAVYTGDLRVAEGEMPEPLFNPTFKIGVLQPGRRLVIRGIRIATGLGRSDGAFLVARRAAHRHLDVPQHGERETHDAGGAAADLSGYKVSCLLADPRHHVLSATLPATTADAAEVRAVFADACAVVKERLRLAGTTIEQRAPDADGGAARRAGPQFTVIRLQDDLREGILHIPGETHTIGELLRRAVCDLAPDIVFVAYAVVAHESRLTLTLRHTEDPAPILLGAVRQCLATFDALQKGIMAAR